MFTGILTEATNWPIFKSGDISFILCISGFFIGSGITLERLYSLITHRSLFGIEYVVPSYPDPKMSPVFSTISTAFDRKSVSSAHFLNSSKDLSSFAPEKDVVFKKISLFYIAAPAENKKRQQSCRFKAKCTVERARHARWCHKIGTPRNG